MYTHIIYSFFILYINKSEKFATFTAVKTWFFFEVELFFTDEMQLL